MTQIIAHRCNLDGPGGPNENTLVGAENARHLGFHAEVDLWLVPLNLGIDLGGQLALGHDINDGQELDHVFLTDLEALSRYLWIHCKNAAVLTSLSRILGTGSKFKFFIHDLDPYALVSDGSLWTFPGSPLISEQCVAVMPERTWYPLGKLAECRAICTDYPRQYHDWVKAYASCNTSSRARQNLEADYLKFLGDIRTSES